MEQLQRWYDSRPLLKYCLDQFQYIEFENRSRITKDIMHLIKEYDDDLLSFQRALEFPLDFKKKRWYDDDPYLWVMFNTLKISNDELLRIIEDYFKTKFRLAPDGFPQLFSPKACFCLSLQT